MKERSEEIVKMYTENHMNTVQIAKLLGCSDSTIGKILRSNGIVPNGKPIPLSIPQDRWGDVVEMYNSGMTAKEVSEQYKVSDATIYNILKRCDIKAREAKRRSSVVNHNYFEKIDTPQKAYFLGWMVTDGSVVKSASRGGRAPMIRIELQSGDRYIIEKFAHELGCDSSVVRDFKKRNHSHFCFASEKMAHDLSHYGVIPRKTYSAYLPMIDEGLMSHLLRGIFDGNGTFTSSGIHPRIGLYGTEQICTQVQEYLHNKIGTPLHKVSKSTCYHVFWGSMKSCKDIYDFLYKDCGDFYLTRKKEKIENLLK